MISSQRIPRLFVLCAVALSACFASIASAEDAPKTTAKILIVTGVEYHKWQETTPVIKKLVAKDSRLEVEVFDEIAKLGELDLSPYDAIIMHFQSNTVGMPGRKALDNMKKYVDGGGGLVMVHFACGAFQEFRDDFEKLAGRVWMGLKPPKGRRQHDPRGEFTVNITKVDHPITRGMKDFKTTDELYTCLIGDQPITVLATAVSKIDGKTYPQAFVHKFGKGRVFHCTLGDNPVAFEAENVAEMYRRACAWAAGLE